MPFWKPCWMPPDAKGSLMALYAFFDESGKFHDGTGFICLCGYLGTDEDWEPFNKRWAYLLRKHRFEHLHLAQFESECRRRGWDDKQSFDVLSDFINAIRAASIFGFAVAVDGRYFKKKFASVGNAKADPALFAVHRMLREIKDACGHWALGSSPRINITFDEDEAYSMKCYQIISRLRKRDADLKELIISIGFADDRYFTPLQAADVFANLTNRYWRDNLDQEAPEPPEALRLLLTASDKDKGPLMWDKPEFWNAKMIDQEWHQLRNTRGV